MTTAVAAQIVRDVAANTSQSQSSVEYGEEERRFRREIEIEWRAERARNPEARLEVPPDIDGLP